jgi:phosphoribosylamine--glycine ligase
MGPARASMSRSGLRVLVVGSGAREHALVWKCLQSPLVARVYVAPGNGGTARIARNLPIPADDPAQLVRAAKKEHVGLVVLGPESAVAAGVGDASRDAGVLVFGPGRDAGRIESSKVFAKELMSRAGIPTAEWAAFSEPEPARRFARKFRGRVAVKADGLAMGKGVMVCGSEEEAEAAIDAMLVRHAFGRAGATVVVEERLEGRELSVFGITDGQRVLPLETARDFKRARDGDQGPNTGGMGAYSPPAGVGPELLVEATGCVLAPAVRELARRGLDYRGVLYAGLMLTHDGLRVLEFNARFGDPECQVILPRLRSDLVPLMVAAADGDLSAQPIVEWSSEAAVAVVVASGGYPDGYQTGFPIEGLSMVPREVLVFHAGTRVVPGRGLVTSGGRVVTMVGLGPDVEHARLAALSGAVRVRFETAYFRKDIALEAVRG